MRSDVSKELDDALEHLGNVLIVLAGLSPGERWQALDNAQEFYNTRRPEAKVSPVPGYVTKLVHVGPLDWPIIREDDG